MDILVTKIYTRERIKSWNLPRCRARKRIEASRGRECWRAGTPRIPQSLLPTSRPAPGGSPRRWRRARVCSKWRLAPAISRSSLPSSDTIGSPASTSADRSSAWQPSRRPGRPSMPSSARAMPPRCRLRTRHSTSSSAARHSRISAIRWARWVKCTGSCDRAARR